MLPRGRAMLFHDPANRKMKQAENKEVVHMRKLVALLLILALLIGLAPAAMAKTYTLDIYWIANKDDETIRTGVQDAINKYLAELHGEKKIKDMEVVFHLVSWDPEWTEKRSAP